jgi:hypothetical protein
MENRRAAPAERRQDQRFKVRLLGRFMRSDRKEFDCESSLCENSNAF